MSANTEAKEVISELKAILEETIRILGEPVGRRESRPTVLPNENKNNKVTRNGKTR